MQIRQVLSRQLRLVLTAFVLTFAITSMAVPASAMVNNEKATSPGIRLAKDSPGAWKCGAWKAHGGIGWRYCAKISRYDDQFTTDYTNSQFNEFRHQTINFNCSTSKSTTWTFGATASVEAEAGVIFAKAKTSISASVSRSTTTTDTTAGSYKIRPRSWAHCKRGTLIYSWSGFTKKVTCDSSTCRTTDMKSYTAHAPSREAWYIGPGRG